MTKPSLITFNHNGEVFDFADAFYVEDKKHKCEIRFDADKIEWQIMSSYIDIFGNEKRKVKTLKDFKR